MAAARTGIPKARPGLRLSNCGSFERRARAPCAFEFVRVRRRQRQPSTAEVVVSRIFICGLGAVSPAGWGVPSLRAALEADLPLPTEAMAGPARPRPLRARAVPVPSTRPAFLAHPRLRRTSPITHYAAAAAVEAFGSFGAGNPTAGSPVPRRLGLICCFQSGCVQYSCRFFEE